MARHVLACGLAVAVCAGAAHAGTVNVSTPAQLAAAMTAAAPGDVITLAPGTYDIPTTKLSATASGTAANRIVVRAAALGEAVVRFGGGGVGVVEGFTVSGAYWRFENLVVRGLCATDSDCEHGFHLVGGDFVEILGSRVEDFNAPIRSNGVAGQFSDDVLIAGVELRNATVRNTANPVQMITADGGRRWIVRNNVIADFGKSQGSLLAFGVVLKANSREGLIERNLVRCEQNNTGGTRIGVSLGGGGSTAASCEGGVCDPEHSNGIIRNNIILGCTDVGIYLNRAANTLVYNNTIDGAAGIDVRFPSSSADVRNNLTSGTVRARDGATVTSGSNVTGVTGATFDSWFVEPDLLDFTLENGSQFVNAGATLPQVTEDFCGNARTDGSTDVGAVEYDGDRANCGPITVTVAGPTTKVPMPNWALALLATLLAAAVWLRDGRLRRRAEGAR